MVKLERTFLDKYINGAFLNKRQIGRPIKYNIRNKGRQGYVPFDFSFEFPPIDESFA
jgi:hypothetical protein